MDMKSPIERAIEIAGGLKPLADAIGVKPPTVHQWKSGQRPVPKERCLQIESFSDGKVRRDELRQDVDWKAYAFQATGLVEA